MNEHTAKQIVNGLDRIVRKLDNMNANHVEIGKLFKAWTEVGEPEELEVEFEDREAFVIGMPVRCTDITSAHYKHIGVIERITTRPVHVRFQHTEAASLYPDQLEILPQPKLHVGDKVRVIDPCSMVYNEIGEVTKPGNASDLPEVKIGELTAGVFERRNLELLKDPVLEVDDIVLVIEERNIHHARQGTIVHIRKDGVIRVMFGGEEGYQIFMADELEKTGEQPYKESSYE